MSPTPNQGAAVLRAEPRASGPVVSVLAAVSELMLSNRSFHGLLRDISGLLVSTVPPVASAGITMASGGRVITVAGSDEVAARLGEHQRRCDDGPGMQALDATVVVESPDLTQERRWNGFPALAEDVGILSLRSQPVVVGDVTVGVLNLYAAERRAFDPATVETADQLGTVVALAITAGLRNYGDATLADQLQTALQSRSVIDQAIGILIGTRQLTAAEAMALLRKRSQNENVRLSALAEELVRRYSGS